MEILWIDIHSLNKVKVQLPKIRLTLINMMYYCYLKKIQACIFIHALDTIIDKIPFESVSYSPTLIEMLV